MISTTPVTFMDHLQLLECQTLPTGPFGYMMWPCGLALSTKLAITPAGVNGGAVHWVHEQHHRRGHTDKQWIIKDIAEFAEGTVTIVYRCSCDGLA